jgi:DNA-binding NtrC family response regulator
VDDEEKLLGSLKRALLDEPYETLFANSGKEAIEILKHNEVHVLVTDMRMPDMSGDELLRIVKEQYPNIVRMVLSGYMHVSTLLEAVNEQEVFKYITKSSELTEELKPAVREALDYYNLYSKHDRVEQLGQPDPNAAEKV